MSTTDELAGLLEPVPEDGGGPYSRIITHAEYQEWVAVAAYYIFLKRLGPSDPSDIIFEPGNANQLKDWLEAVGQIQQKLTDERIAVEG